MRWRAGGVLALGLALASCGGILPKPPPPPALYRLTPAPEAASTAPAIDAQLVVDMPSSPHAIDTDRIALSRGPLRLDYFADAAWTDRAPALVQALMIESLENAGRIGVVARPSGELRPDAVLMSELRRFEADYDGAGNPTIRVRLDCRIVRMPDRAVLGIKRFAGTASAARNDTPAIVAAFDTAFHQAMAGIAAWTADTLAASQR
jgi:cholesterol transport system auxiliary component